MSTESLNRTPETKVNETLMFNDGVLKQEHNLVVKPNLVNKTKRTCVNSVNQRRYIAQKKDKIKNRAIIFTIFFSSGSITIFAELLYFLSKFNEKR